MSPFDPDALDRTDGDVRQSLEALVRSLGPRRVAVIGDVMLDRYVRGQAHAAEPRGADPGARGRRRVRRCPAARPTSR